MAGNHWSFEDDEFLVSYYDTMGDFIGEHDLGRPKGAATRRVAHLKKTGAWDALVEMQAESNRANSRHLRAEIKYAKALGYDVQETGCTDEDAECPADIYDPGYNGMPWRRDPWGEDDERKRCEEMETHVLMRRALEEAERQIVYLHEKFSPTGSGEATLTKVRAAIEKARP